MLDLADDPAGAPLRMNAGIGFEYSDCVTDDARLVIANAIDARERGADIRTRTRLVSRAAPAALGTRDRRRCKTRNDPCPSARERRRSWAANVIETIVKGVPPVRVRLVKGSHIVYPRLYSHDRAYVLQSDDRRVIFVVPFGERHTLIGTTDVETSGDPGQAAASAEEIQYLCRLAAHFFRTGVEPSRVVWTFAGVRPLIGDGKGSASTATREYQIVADGGYGEAPLLSLIGGKLTAFRAMSEDVVNRLGHWFAMRPAWTAHEPLPGGDLGSRGMEGLYADLAREHAYLPEATARRIALAYGRRAINMLGDAKRIEDLGPLLVGDLRVRELEYLRRHEWAKTADDVLFRRTKLGIGASNAEVDAVQAALGA